MHTRNQNTQGERSLIFSKRMLLSELVPALKEKHKYITFQHHQPLLTGRLGRSRTAAKEPLQRYTYPPHASALSM